MERLWPCLYLIPTLTNTDAASSACGALLNTETTLNPPDKVPGACLCKLYALSGIPSF